MKKKYLWILILGLYVLFIFSNSMKVADTSSKDSGRVLYLIHGMLNKFEINAYWLTEHFIRKMGHFSEYSLLGLLLFGSMKSQGFQEERRWLFHITTGFLVPFMDETIQLFVEGRSGQISDVWLDCAGVTFGTLTMVGVVLIRKRMEILNVEKLSNRTRI
jgi:VanZ family protein